jgi:ABC-type nickel/cobalt efflux system permease component RcnA
MTSPLSSIPIDKRRQAAATVGLFAVLLVAVGAVAATGRTSAAAPVFSVISLLLAVLLGLVSWGILRSVRMDLADQRLDAAIEATLADRPEYASLCSCGHDHDPNVLHVVDEEVADEACSHDGGGAACAHDCGTCVLAALRPSPNRTRADRLA